MTLIDIYRRSIRPLPPGDRLQLARLILNDLSTGEAGDSIAPDRPGEIRDEDHREELLLAGLNSGPGIEATAEYWSEKRNTLLARQSAKTSNP